MTVRTFLPWRSATFGWVLTAGLLVYGVPLFLRMPPWCDLTLYDVAVANVRGGGVHYQDVFDTNLPGFVWLLAVVRILLGDSYEAVRAVDLAVVAGTMILLGRWAKRSGATAADIAWMAAGAAFFYPFTTEFSHAQRDVWMLLPAVYAVWRRQERLAGPPVDPFRPAVLDGVVWGVAVWVKPHVVIPAACVWLFTVRRVMADSPRPWAMLRRDFLGNLLGGTLVGLVGLGWLAATGALGPMLEVSTKWNSQYAAYIWWEAQYRLPMTFGHFPPVSYALPVGIVMAVVNLIVAKPWKRARQPVERFRRGVLGTLLLAWVVQAAVVQRMFEYVHVPELLLLFALFAANRWSGLTAAPLAVAVACGGVWLWLDDHPEARGRLERDVFPTAPQPFLLPRYPTVLADRPGKWPGCFRFGLSEREYRQRQVDLALMPGTFASPSPVDSLEVADELRRLGAGDGEVICWHNTTHQVYLDLGVRPGIRFMRS
jgi:hypothetical protein